ncbi:MAG TPA: ABC transporter ATP-binding protein, partial [bacterium]|nr:ABC transporter ATP-binding protein [bacterium]
MSLLEVRNLVTAYGSVEALHGISFRVDEGEIVALLGANGAGKTTALRTISGLLRPRSGEVRFADERIDTRPAHEIVRLGLTHVPEGRWIFTLMTVDENLRLGAYAETHLPREALERVFTLFPRLAERRGQLAGTLSGGEQQMLAMARALMARPRLLLLDEPSMGLAPVLVRAIFQTVAAINREGTTVLLVEQNANAALRLARRAYVLENGRIALEGLGSELAKNEAVRRAYLGIGTRLSAPEG